MEISLFKEGNLPLSNGMMGKIVIAYIRINKIRLETTTYKVWIPE